MRLLALVFLNLSVFTSLFYAFPATMQQATMLPQHGYILTDRGGRIVDKSGVRIGLLDLEFENVHSLENIYNLTNDLVKKLTSYTGLRGENALNFLRTKPLSIELSYYESMNKNLRHYWLERLPKSPAFVKKPLEVFFF
jgi:hypothetical protein